MSISWKEELAPALFCVFVLILFICMLGGCKSADKYDVTPIKETVEALEQAGVAAVVHATLGPASVGADTRFYLNFGVTIDVWAQANPKGKGMSTQEVLDYVIEDDPAGPAP